MKVLKFAVVLLVLIYVHPAAAQVAQSGPEKPATLEEASQELLKQTTVCLKAATKALELSLAPSSTPQAVDDAKRVADRACVLGVTVAMMKLVETYFATQPNDRQSCSSNLTKAARLPGGLCAGIAPDPVVLEKFHPVCQAWVSELGVNKPKQCDDLMPLPPKKNQ